jgi:hypothetical protein
MPRQTQRAVVLASLVALPRGFGQKAAHACANMFKGKDRTTLQRAVAADTSYTNLNNKHPVTLPKFFESTCPFDAQRPTNDPGKKPITTFETLTATVPGFLLDATLENDTDRDIYAKLASTTIWLIRHDYRAPKALQLTARQHSSSILGRTQYIFTSGATANGHH